MLIPVIIGWIGFAMVFGPPILGVIAAALALRQDNKDLDS